MLKAVIQRVKGHLFNREFGRAFEGEEALEAYAVRWSPVRSLAYLSIFAGVRGVSDGLRNGERRKVVCLGGGAGAEVGALGGLLCQADAEGWGFAGSAAGDENTGDEDGDGVEGKEGRTRRWDIIAVDIAPWGSVIRKLESAITTPPPSTSGATSAEEAHQPLVEANDFTVQFQQRDILALSSEELTKLCHDASMVNLMFTLNELYSTSISQTTRLLLQLTGCVSKGCLLVVVDSPGSYSTLALNKQKDAKGGSNAEKEGANDGASTVNKEGKKYPMQWLLDHTLLEVATTKGENEGRSGGKEGKHWEKVHSEDSRWFRLSERLRYPIALEDMRMQVHVYERL